MWGQSGWREREGEKGSHKIRKERRKRGCNEGFSGCLTRPWHDMPPAGWNGFPSGCQGNLWSTPPASTLWLYRLNSRAQPRCPHHTHCYTETESTDRKIRQRVRVHTRPVNPGPRTVANGHAEFTISILRILCCFFSPVFFFPRL